MADVENNMDNLQSSNENIKLASNNDSLYDFVSSKILIFLLLIFVILVPIFLFFKKGKSRRDVLLLGLSDSGKTLIFSRLLHSRFVQTHTSVKENVGEFQRAGGDLRIVDIPGHERLRLKFFDQFKSTARAIVFVIDSVTLPKDIRDVAEFLYTILTDNAVVSMRPNFLILCNKHDMPTAKGANAVSQILQKEMNTLRVTKASQLESIDRTKNVTTVLSGKDGKEFEWSSLPYKVTFVECTAFFSDDEEKSADLEKLSEWLQKL